MTAFDESSHSDLALETSPIICLGERLLYPQELPFS
jgi:hypothetical protein